MKAIWFLEEVLYLINIIFFQENFLCIRGQKKAQREEHPFKVSVYPDTPTCRSSTYFTQKQYSG